MHTDVIPHTNRDYRLRPFSQPAGQSTATWRYGKRLLLSGCAVVAIVLVAMVLVHTLGSSDNAATGLTHTVTYRDLRVTVVEKGMLESSENMEIKCKVRGHNTVTWVIESGTYVQPGDELVRLDTLFIEEQVNERSKYAHWSRSAAEHSKADLTRAELAIDEYQKGRYVAQLTELEKQLAIAEARLRTNRSLSDYVKKMCSAGYRSELEVEEGEFAVTQAEASLEGIATRIDVLKRFTRAEELERLKGNLAATRARHEADVERAMADASRRDRALAEYECCIVKADVAGLVIHPNAARWENAPKIAQGVRVHKDQVLLLMPDLAQMQVLVGIRESEVDRVVPGMPARVTLPTKVLHGEVATVAEITKPAGWWTGNVVKYDTTVTLSEEYGLMPGMSAEVEILVAEHKNVLTVPVAAVVETERGPYCWVDTGEGPQARPLNIGDSNNVHTIVTSGLKEGDAVFLNPLGLEEAKRMALTPSEAAKKFASRSDEDSKKNREKPVKDPNKNADGEARVSKTQPAAESTHVPEE